jgi:hypothetical protein
MKSTELRVGNIVKYAKGVYAFAGEETEIGNIIQGETDFYEPIPITEEWLLKFGFTKDNYGTFYIKEFDKDKNWLWVKIQKDGIGVALNLFNEKPITYLNTIYFVHTLQNLFFALACEELEIKQ